MSTTKKIRGVFNSCPLSTLKADTLEKEQTAYNYRLRVHINRFDPKRDLHEFTCHFIQLRANAFFMEFSRKQKQFPQQQISKTPTFLTTHTTVFLFLTDTTRQATIHTQHLRPTRRRHHDSVQYMQIYRHYQTYKTEIEEHILI